MCFTHTFLMFFNLFQITFFLQKSIFLCNTEKIAFLKSPLFVPLIHFSLPHRMQGHAPTCQLTSTSSHQNCSIWYFRYLMCKIRHTSHNGSSGNHFHSACTSRSHHFQKTPLFIFATTVWDKTFLQLPLSDYLF